MDSALRRRLTCKSLLASDPQIQLPRSRDPWSFRRAGNRWRRWHAQGCAGDYAVFAPRHVSRDRYDFRDRSISGRCTEYVYTYLVNNEAASDVQQTLFSVGLASGSGAHNAGTNNSLGGQAPDPQVITSSSFLHFYDGIAPGSSSNITLFTSPNPPTFGSASVGDGGLSDQELMPTPLVPEPASLGLLVAAGMMAFGRRRNQEASLSPIPVSQSIKTSKDPSTTASEACRRFSFASPPEHSSRLRPILGMPSRFQTPRIDVFHKAQSCAKFYVQPNCRRIKLCKPTYVGYFRWLERAFRHLRKGRQG